MMDPVTTVTVGVGFLYILLIASIVLLVTL
jgi:hypothetical protein